MSRTINKPWRESNNLPQKIDDALFAFPATVCGTLLPYSEDIPEEFRGHSRTVWHDCFNHMFFGDGRDEKKKHPLEKLAECAEEFDPKFHMKEGIDGETAYRHLMACMRSFEPQHQHKEAGCAYLMSLWFEKIEWYGKVYEPDPEPIGT